MTEETRQTTAMALPDETSFVRDIKAINRFQQVAHANMVSGLDYGIIPGTDKPSLLKPGAEKIAKLLELADIYEILDMKEDWDKPFFRYMVKCKLVSVNMNITITEGMGECNSMESKYRWRESKRVCPSCGAEAIILGKPEYGGGWVCFKKQGGCGAKFQIGDASIESQKVGRVENDDIYSQVNTLLKMAMKRALVGAALSAGRLSDIFTQDMEDIGGFTKEEAKVEEEKPATKAKTKPNKGAKKVNEFMDACVQAGYDITKLPDMIEIGKWLVKHFSVKHFPDLTEEVQDRAIALRLKTTKADDATEKPSEELFY